MRYIDLNELAIRANWPPQEWQERAEKAYKELKNTPDRAGRAAVFKKYSDLWSALKEDFKNLSDGKCWYCEVKTDGMRGDMDHYRPKGRVTENPEHSGYWWLAFEWRNYRFSCERCNSLGTDSATGRVGGKANYFPLVGDDESRRIRDECEYEDLLNEDPLLLDPTEPDDPQLLTFQSDGLPGPRIDNPQSPEYIRVAGSIKIYHLDHSVSNRQRRRVYNRIATHIRSYKLHIESIKEDRSNRSARAGIKQVTSELHELTARNAEYTMAARAYLEMQRQKHPELILLRGIG